jgi:hypothetical protein
VHRFDFSPPARPEESGNDLKVGRIA